MNNKGFFFTVIVGFVMGVFIVQPLGISLFLYDNQGDQGSWWNILEIVFVQIAGFGDFDQILKNLLFGCLGISLALMFYTRKKIFQLDKLKNETDIIEALIAKGETSEVEFKSTLRCDLRQSKINKALEVVVAKTIAGFINCKGGNLLIGIDDEGHILGLQEDYQTLKKPGRDGFEQYIMQLVSFTLGSRFCPLIKVTFHEFKGRDIYHLNIQSSKTPVFLNYEDRSHFFIRTGNGTRELDIPEALAYIGKGKALYN